MSEETVTAKQLLYAAALIIASEFFFATAGAVVKTASVDLPTSMVVFFRNFFALLLLLPLVIRYGWSSFKTKVLALHLRRALVGVSAMYCFFYSLASLTMADAMLLKMTAPIFVPLMAFIFLKESTTAWLLLAVSIGFSGVALIIQPDGNFTAGEYNWIALIGLAGGFFSAIAKVTVRKLTRTEPALRVVFYFALFATMVSAVPLLWEWTSPDATGYIWLLLVGLTTTLGQICLTRGYAAAPASRVVPFTYVSVIFAAAYGYVFWNEVPDMVFAFGAVLIAIAGGLAVYVKQPRPVHIVAEQEVVLPDAALLSTVLPKTTLNQSDKPKV